MMMNTRLMRTFLICMGICLSVRATDEARKHRIDKLNTQIHRQETLFFQTLGTLRDKHGVPFTKDNLGMDNPICTEKYGKYTRELIYSCDPETEAYASLKVLKRKRSDRTTYPVNLDTIMFDAEKNILKVDYDNPKRSNFRSWHKSMVLRLGNSNDARDTNKLVSTLTYLKNVQQTRHTLMEELSGKMEDFEILQHIGQGAFGKVMRVKHKATGEIYAMKAMKKRQTNQVKFQSALNKKNEREVGAAVKSRYVSSLRYAFQDESRLYLVTDFYPGGDLSTLLKSRQIKKDFCFGFLDEEVKFYAAEMVLALEAMHKAKFVYRDLKPENIVLDEDGHIKLIDFGLSKKLKRERHGRYRTYTWCGTPGYMAPEVIRGDHSHSYSADWWGLGCVIYELFLGVTPSYDQKGHINLKHLKKCLTPEAEELITRLLDTFAYTRLGGSIRPGSKGVADIKNMAFFKGIDWDKLESGEVVMTPPWKPRIDSFVIKFDKELPFELEARDNGKGAKVQCLVDGLPVDRHEGVSGGRHIELVEGLETEVNDTAFVDIKEHIASRFKQGQSVKITFAPDPTAYFEEKFTGLPVELHVEELRLRRAATKADYVDAKTFPGWDYMNYQEIKKLYDFTKEDL